MKSKYRLNILDENLASEIVTVIAKYKDVVLELVPAAITRYHKLNGLNNKHFFPHHSGGEEVQCQSIDRFGV